MKYVKVENQSENFLFNFQDFPKSFQLLDNHHSSKIIGPTQMAKIIYTNKGTVRVCVCLSGFLHEIQGFCKLHISCCFSYADFISDNIYLGKMPAIISDNVLLTKCVTNQKLPAGPRIQGA